MTVSFLYNDFTAKLLYHSRFYTPTRAKCNFFAKFSSKNLHNSKKLTNFALANGTKPPRRGG